MAEPVMLCRCYEITLAEVEAAIANGARTVNDVKRATRAAMGLCQGIYCTTQIAELIAEHTGQSRAAIAPMTARPPARFVTLADLEATVPEPAE